MRSSLSAVAILLLALSGCDQAATPVAAMPSAAPIEQTQSLDLGSYTKNQARLELRHYLVLPGDDPLKFRVLFTPDALSDAVDAATATIGPLLR